MRTNADVKVTLVEVDEETYEVRLPSGYVAGEIVRMAGGYWRIYPTSSASDVRFGERKEAIRTLLNI